MRFRLFGTDIRISFLFLALLCAVILIDRTGIVVPMIGAAALHEAGHLFCLWFVGAAPKEVSLVPGSVQLTVRGYPTTRQQLLVSVTGPAVNLFLAVLLAVHCALYDEQTYLPFCLLNALFGFFNLLPFAGLDGGEILLILIRRKKGEQKSRWMIRLITVICAVLVLVAAIWQTVYGQTNYGTYLVVLYLILSVLLKR